MSVTVSQQPDDYVPCHNPQIFTGLSNQTAQTNFAYEVVVTDVVSSTSKTYKISPRPDGYCVFDAQPFAESFITNYIPINEYGWKTTGASRKIRVNIGERYGAGAGTYYAGTNIDFIVWNGVLDFLDVPGYNQDDFVYVAGTTPNQVYLTSQENDITYEDRSNYLYVLTQASGDLQALEIQVFDAAGNQINTAQIDNPYYNSTNYREKYLCIDVGYKGLSNMASGDVVIGWPIDLSNAAYYLLYDNSVTGNPPSGTQNLIRRIDIYCEPVYPVYTLHYLAKNGRFETLNFSKRSDIEVRRESTSYKKLPYAMSGGVYSYDRSAAVEKTLSSLRTERLKLNTDWLTEEEITRHEEIIDSPVIYLDLGDTLAYPQIKVVTDTYKRVKRYNEKLYQLQLDFEYTHENHRQK